MCFDQVISATKDHIFLEAPKHLSGCCMIWAAVEIHFYAYGSCCFGVMTHYKFSPGHLSRILRQHVANVSFGVARSCIWSWHCIQILFFLFCMVGFRSASPSHCCFSFFSFSVPLLTVNGWIIPYIIIVLLRFNLFVWFWLGMKFKKVNKTFEFCGLELEIYQMFQNFL